MEPVITGPYLRIDRDEQGTMFFYYLMRIKLKGTSSLFSNSLGRELSTLWGEGGGGFVVVTRFVGKHLSRSPLIGGWGWKFVSVN